MIQVNIQGMSNEKFKIDIGENESELKSISVLTLKNKIIANKGLDISSEFLRLIFAGKQLENEKMLSDYGITDKSLILMVLRVKGGLD
jgi:ubiquitin-large subunit ribosomal protein L40e